MSEEISREEIAALLARGSEEMTREEAVKALIDMANALCLNPDTPQGIALKMAIKALKQELKIGRWILTIEDWNKWTCSECGFSERTDIHVTLGYHFCPKCGAKMESENKE